MKKATLTILIILFCAPLVFASQEVYVQIRFNEKTPHGQYNDALYFTEEEYAKVSQKDIDTLCQKRVDAWIERVENPPIYVEPSKEDYLNMYQQRIDEAQQYLNKYSEKASKAELEAVKVALDAKTTALSAEIAKK